LIRLRHGHYAIMTDMKPENVTPPNLPEFGTTAPLPNLEQLPPLANRPGGVEGAPEAGLRTGGERHEQAAELRAVRADATATAGAMATPQSVAGTSVVQDTTALSGNTSPLTAGHDDVMEKEWVDRAKQIVSETKDDPNQRKQRVDQLQLDYLHKRYGKDLGAA